MSVLLITDCGSGDDVAVVVAALAVVERGSVALVQLAQTGLADGRAGELDRTTRLAPVAQAQEFARYPVDLLPAHAAAVTGRAPLVFADTVRRLLDLDTAHARVLVRGSGGLLAPYDDERRTLVDLAPAVGAAVVIVAPADPDGFERLSLTLAVLTEQALPFAGVVLTGWPSRADDRQRWAVADLWRLSERDLLAGVVPAGAGAWAPHELRRRARNIVGTALGGTFDARAFVARHAPG